MDNTELHYLTYDPDRIMMEMLEAYMDEGGDALYPGDEKSMLLSAVLAVMTQAFAGVDNALRMATLRYAVGDYLDVIGETRLCERVQATCAAATVTITEDTDGVTRTLSAGLALCDSSGMLYTLDEDVTLHGAGSNVSAAITCGTAGSAGNAMTTGTQLTFMTPQLGAVSVVCSAAAAGGMDEEDDEAFRERIRVSGAKNITTGTQLQYEAAVKGVSSEIIDARAVNGGNGVVNIYIILKNAAHAQTILSEVRGVLIGYDTRPMTDSVNVYQATDISYTLKIKYYADSGSNVADAVAAAITEYQEWQDNVIGRAFNPDMMIAKLYAAGCTRVLFESGSAFNGGDVEYTTIGAGQRCKGTVTAVRATT